MWQENIVEHVRNLIGDVDSPYTYSDDRIISAIITASCLMLREIDFDNDYVVNIITKTITPDPITEEDYNFIALSALKTAVVITSGELKKYSLTSNIKVTDGPSSIDTTGRFESVQKANRYFSDEYNTAKIAYVNGNRTIYGVTTPTTVSNLAPRWL